MFERIKILVEEILFHINKGLNDDANRAYLESELTKLYRAIEEDFREAEKSHREAERERKDRDTFQSFQDALRPFIERDNLDTHPEG